MALKDFNKKQLLKMRTAVRTTRALHEKAVETGKSYAETRYTRFFRRINQQNAGRTYSCPLCEYKHSMQKGCRVCPWVIIDKRRCNMLSYNDSHASIVRLARWEVLIKTEIDARRKP